MIRFNGHITARSPIQVSYPETEGLPRTPHGEVMLMSGTFRGPLRQAALRAVRREIAKAQGIPESEVMSGRDAYLNGQGVDTTREIVNESSGSIDPWAERELRERNPLLSTFGRWHLPSYLSVGDMRADDRCVMTVGQGARADMFDRDPNEVLYLSVDEQAKLKEQLESGKKSQRDIDALNDEKKQIRKDAKAAQNAGNDAEAKKLWDRAREIDSQIKSVKDEREGAAESIRRPLAGFEAISPRTELSHWLTVLDENILGLVIAALAEFSREPYIGGHRARGFGEIACEYTVTERPVGVLKPQVIGTISFDADRGFIIEGERLEAAYQTFLDTAGQWNLSILTLAQAREAADS